MKVRDREQRSTAAAVAAVVIGLLLLVVLYTLSVGPIIYYYGGVPLDGQAARVFHTVYHPLLWLGDHGPLKQPLRWYAGMWLDDPGPLQEPF